MRKGEIIEVLEKGFWEFTCTACNSILKVEPKDIVKITVYEDKRNEFPYGTNGFSCPVCEKQYIGKRPPFKPGFN